MFQPGLKNLREEKDRQKSQVAYPTHGDEGPLGIDLDAGTARITMPPHRGTAGPAATPPPTEGTDPPADGSNPTEAADAAPVTQETDSAAG